MRPPRLGRLELVNDRSPVEWWARQLKPWDSSDLPLSVQTFLPAGYPGYIRILHPVRWGDGDPSHLHEREPVPWSTVAVWSGRDLTATSLFYDIGVRADGTRWSALGYMPAEGTLEEDLCAELARGLSSHTATPELAWFCLWTGWGDLGPELRGLEGIEITPRITGSGRRYLLLRGRVEDVVDLRIGGTEYRRFQSPSFWWPEDRSWFVSTEIDALSSYVGGPNALIERLLDHEGIEAFEARLDDSFDGTHPGQVMWS